MDKDELKRLQAELGRAGPRVCCTCKGRLRRADEDEMRAIKRLYREGIWPADVAGHKVEAAKVCASCGHVTVLSVGHNVMAVWCPGFGLRRRLVPVVH
jgi:hypothetical protein